MIIQTGMRTDIPAFYSKWFLNRIKEGYVCVRNPYNPKTGDNSNTFLWIVLLLISGGTVICIIVYNKKRKYKK